MFEWLKRCRQVPSPPPGPLPVRPPSPEQPQRLVRGSAGASLLLGVSAAGAGRWHEALIYFDHVIALQPENPDGHAYRGQVLAVLQRPDEALAALDEALRLNPDHGHALLERGLLHQRRGAPSLALADYTSAVERASELRHRVAARYNRALLYDQAGDTQRAEHEFKEVLLVQPGYPPASNSLATMCIKRGLAGRDGRWLHMAVNVLNRALEAHPDDVICRVTRGQALALLGKFAAAQADLQVAVQSSDPVVRTRAQEVLDSIAGKA